MPTSLLSIGSPGTGTFDLGPLTIHLYGLMLLLAIAACIALTGVRWVRLGGDWDLVLRVAVWGVAFGVAGARAYHVVTSWDEVPDEWWGVFAVWEGGLGVWGGILLGCLAGAVVIHRAGQSVRLFADAVAPGLLLAQGIGRWGNYWNQELYGKPTGLPWGIEIDPEHRAALAFKYQTATTFHPTFFYEFLYDLVLVGVLLLVARRFHIRPPGLFALYVSVYTFGRTFEELLRIDPSGHLFGLRVNLYVSMIVFLASTAFFVRWQFFRRAGEGEHAVRAAPPKGPSMAVPKGRVRWPR